MNDTVGLAVFEHLAHGHADLQDLAEPKLSFLHQLSETGALHNGHDEEERPLVLAEVVDGDDRGMVQPRDDLSLGLEALLRFGSEKARGDQLDGNLAVELRIASAIDHSHPASSQLIDDLVSIGELLPDHRDEPSRCMNLENPGCSGVCAILADAGRRATLP